MVRERYKKPPVERFWPKVDKSGDCWLWTASRDGLHRYGMFWLPPRFIGAHRASWIFVHGPIPNGLFVCHSCDTPACVRPEHLFLATNAGNVADMDAKGRRVVVGLKAGIEHHLAKLNPERVRELREAKRLGASLNALAKRYGLDRSTVTDAVRGKTWKQVS